MIAVTLLLVHQLFGVLLALGISPAPAGWTALLVTLSPPLLIHSILFFTEVVSALLVLLVFRAIMLDDRGGTARRAIVGIVTGFLLVVHARNAGLVLALLVLAGYRWRQRESTATEAMAFAGGFVTMLIARTALTYQLWGTWLTTPHARSGEWEGVGATLAVMGRRLMGLLIDQEFGLLLYAPIFLLALFAMGPRSGLSREIRGAIALSIAAYLLTILMPMTNVHGWTGDGRRPGASGFPSCRCSRWLSPRDQERSPRRRVYPGGTPDWDQRLLLAAPEESLERRRRHRGGLRAR